jgi:hypothetical protein
MMSIFEIEIASDFEIMHRSEQLLIPMTISIENLKSLFKSTRIKLDYCNVQCPTVSILRETVIEIVMLSLQPVGAASSKIDIVEYCLSILIAKIDS